MPERLAASDRVCTRTPRKKSPAKIPRGSAAEFALRFFPVPLGVANPSPRPPNGRCIGCAHRPHTSRRISRARGTHASTRGYGLCAPLRYPIGLRFGWFGFGALRLVDARGGAIGRCGWCCGCAGALRVRERVICLELCMGLREKDARGCPWRGSREWA